MKPPTCPRCQSIYSVKFKDGRPTKNPLLLRCGHTFCESCILKFPHENDSVECAICQVPSKVGKSNSDFYRHVNPDLYTVGIIWTRHMDLDLQSKKIKGGSTSSGETKEPAPGKHPLAGVSCSECRLNAATCQCIKCDCILCRPCFDKIHQLSNIFKKHQPVPYSPVRDERVAGIKKTRIRRCLVHEQCQIEYFCNDDKQAICSRCVIVGDHKGHDVQTMEDKNKDLLLEMEPAVLVAKETLWRLEKSEQALRKVMPRAQTDTSGVVEEVRNHFRELHSLLQAREEQLLEEIQEAAIDAAKPFEEMKNFLLEEKMNFELALVDAARVMQGNLHRLLDADLVLERLHRAKDLPCVLSLQPECTSTIIKFVPDSAFRDIVSAVGNISAVSSSQLFHLSVPGPEAEKPSEEELRHYSVLDLETLSTTDTESITDSASVIMEEDKEESVEEAVAAVVARTESGTRPSRKPFTIGHMEKVLPIHIKTPAQFYVHLVSRCGEQATMEEQVQRYCRSAEGKKAIPELVEPGCLVLAQYSENKRWYRARILAVMETEEDADDQTFQVDYIDYGNSEIVPLNRLRKVKKKFEKPDPFAYRCALFDILPLDETTGWTSEAATTMLEITQGGPMIMQVVRLNGNVMEVDLSRPETVTSSFDPRPISVRDSLVFLEMAKFNTRALPTAGMPTVPKDYISMPRQDEGDVLDIGINSAHHPGLFYAQVYSEQGTQELQRLLSAMQQTYSKETRHLYTMYCPRKDTLCVARYPKDNNWYRAKVTGLPGGRRVEVQFVDYGNTELVDHRDVCKILDNYVKYPKQAWECALADVEPLTNGQWSNQAVAWFKSTVELQLCQLRVISYKKKANSMVGVLYTISKGRLCCVNYQLVSMGFANSTGRWSEEESFLGITMRPETHRSLIGTSASEDTSSSCSPTREPLSSSPCTTPSALLATTSPARAVMPLTSLDAPSSPGRAVMPLTSLDAPSSPGRAVMPLTSLDAPRPQPASLSPSNLLASPAQHKSKTGHKKRNSPKRLSAGRNVALDSVASDTASSSCASKSKSKKAADVTESPKEAKEAACSPAGGSVAVLITGYQSPGHFFIQLEDKQNELATLMENLSKCNKMLACDQQWKEKMFCIAKSTRDDCWYRGRLEKSLDDDLFEVCLLDYGFLEQLPASRLQPLKRSFGKIECFAERCHLANIKPAGSIDLTKWSNTAKEIFLRKTQGKRLFVKMEGDRVETLGLPVDILIEETIPETAFDPPTHEYVSLSKLLLEKGLALPDKRQQDCSEGLSDLQTFQTKLLACEDQDAGYPDTQSVRSWLAEGQAPMVIKQPTLTIALHPPPATMCMTMFPVFVDYDGIIYAHDVAEEKKIDELMESLADYANKTTPAGILEVSRGQICLARFETDDAWYRARVLEVTDFDVKVKYVDYGNAERMDKTRAARNLRLITDELCQPPQVAYLLKLHNARPTTVDGSWPHSFLDYMHHQIVSTHVTVEVKGEADQTPLEVDIVLENGSNITTTLVELGVLARDNDMEEFYQRSSDISNILRVGQHSNPYFPLQLGRKGDVMTGLVTHIELPNLVYIQRGLSPVDGSIPPDVEEFIQMMEDLNNLPPQTPVFEELPAVGEECSARFSQDNRWYRGLVVKINKINNTALIFYVDYGNSEIVTLERLRVLPQRFQDAPAQALRAYLNVDLPAGCKRWTFGTYKAMVDAIFLRSHFVHVKNVDPLTVELYSCGDVTDNGSILSYQHLVKMGLISLPPELDGCRDEMDSVIVEGLENEITDLLDSAV